MSADQPGRSRSSQAGAPAPPGSLTGSTVDFLTGQWNVVRDISDARSGTTGRFRGTASFTPAAGGARFAEEGEIAFGSHRGPASRSLIYAARTDGAADVFFADGREFFRLDLTSGDCQAEHLCRADRYEVTVSRTGDDSFTEIWRVTGPAKDYQLSSRYSRASSTADGLGAT